MLSQRVSCQIMQVFLHIDVVKQLLPYRRSNKLHVLYPSVVILVRHLENKIHVYIVNLVSNFRVIEKAVKFILANGSILIRIDP